MAESSTAQVAAVVLAAGLSSRMGTMKALLPWGNNRSVLAHILDQLRHAGLASIVVVTGHQAEAVARETVGFDVQFARNYDFANGEMLRSIQAGLRALPVEISAAIVVLGDQPQIQSPIVAQIIQTYWRDHSLIVMPSFEMRRGHPMLLDRRLWAELLALPDGATAREVINRHAAEINYVPVNNDSILRDMDTPQEYEVERKRAGFA
ncbi:MAG: nucleotidyltransferase family protein [Anaerolineae bacterium]|nr:nucleotidyltransferase family protein [Anaerolineae bacterium]